MTLLKESAVKKCYFNQLKASQVLKQLAEHPFDLTEEGSLTPQRLSKFVAESAGYRLLYGTERVNEETMHALFELAKEARAVEKMEKMQGGEILNFIQGFPSEDRAVLHTASRDFFDSPNQSAAAKLAAKTCRQETDKLKQFIKEIDQKGSFHDLVVVAIGGSELGPKAHFEALKTHQRQNRNVYFVPNLDPDCVAMALKKVNLKKTLVVVISKTGTTLETLTNEEILRQHFLQLGLNPQEHFVAVTAEGSPMDDKKRYLEVFHIWDWIGGRFSSSSIVGGFPMAFAYGFEVYWEFLRGANAMDKAALSKDFNKNIPMIAALIGVWNRNFLKLSNLAIVPYSESLARYPAHIQQVDMESNGKHIDQHGNRVDFETGPIVFGEPGTNAQHSFFQLLHQGTTIVPIEFIGFKEGQTRQDALVQGTSSQEKLISNFFAQSLALALGQQSDNPNKDFEGNRPSHILLARQLSPFALGALLAYYEHKVAFQGFIWGINSFDQEGVSLGKAVAGKIIGRFAAQQGIAKGGSQPYPLGDTLMKQLETL